jgi:hypothetical protein
MRTFVPEPELQHETKPGKTVTPYVTRRGGRPDVHLVRQLQRTIGNRAVRRLLEESISNTTEESDAAAYGVTRRRIQRLGLIPYGRTALTPATPPVRVDRDRDEEQDQETTGAGATESATGQSETAVASEPAGAATGSGGEGSARQAEIAAAPEQASAAQTGEAAPAGGAEGAGTGKATEQGAAVADAPSASYIVPFDRSPQAAPGERIIFRGDFTDPSPPRPAGISRPPPVRPRAPSTG